MDAADLSQRHDEILLKANLYKSKKAAPSPAACGCCLNCEKPLAEPGRRWCDADCRDIWWSENA